MLLHSIALDSTVTCGICTIFTFMKFENFWIMAHLTPAVSLKWIWAFITFHKLPDFHCWKNVGHESVAQGIKNTLNLLYWLISWYKPVKRYHFYSWLVIVARSTDWHVCHRHRSMVSVRAGWYLSCSVQDICCAFKSSTVIFILLNETVSKRCQVRWKEVIFSSFF